MSSLDSNSSTPILTICEDDLSHPATLALLALHLAGMQDGTPPEHVFALDLSGLRVPEITVWSAWSQERIAAMGALKMLPDGNAEVQSMRTHPDFLRQGAARAVLDMLIAAAHARGVQRLSLETGVGSHFEPALALYRHRGFRDGVPFATYTPSPYSRFLHLDRSQFRIS